MAALTVDWLTITGSTDFPVAYIKYVSDSNKLCFYRTFCTANENKNFFQ